MTAPAATRPTALEPIFQNFPPELIPLPQWLVWSYLWMPPVNGGKPGRWTKPPLRAMNLQPASVTDPSTWATFEEAKSRYEMGGCDGVGIALLSENNLVVFDVDDCRDPRTGDLDADAQEIVAKADTYWEPSPSGAGIRIFTMGKKPGDRCRSGRYEVYDQDAYLTVTGAMVTGGGGPGGPRRIEERQEFVEWYYQTKILGPGVTEAPADGPAAPPADPAVEEKRAALRELITDGDVIGRARAAKNGETFRKLFDQGDRSMHVHEDGTPDPSVSDAALVSFLLYYSIGDVERTDRLFRKSGLMRPKWDETRGDSTYGRKTVLKILSKMEKFWEPGYGGKEERTYDAACGLKLVVSDDRRTTVRLTVSGHASFQEQSQRFSYNDTPTSKAKTLDRILKLLPSERAKEARREVDMLLDRILDDVEKAERDRPKRPDMLSIVYQKASDFALLSKHTYGREIVAWSEREKTHITQRTFIERMLHFDVLEELRSAEDYEAMSSSALVNVAKRLAEACWAQILKGLKEAPEADGVKPGTAIEAEVRRQIVDLFHLPRDIGDSIAFHLLSSRSEYHGSSQLSAGLVYLRDHVTEQVADEVQERHKRGEVWKGEWYRPPRYAAWGRLRWAPGDERAEVQLAIHHALLIQTKSYLPGVRNEATLRKLLGKLGLLAADDFGGTDQGKRKRIIVLSPSMVADIAALFEAGG